MPVQESLVEQIRTSVKDAEALLDKWQAKIHADTAAKKVQYYAFPNIVKYLMIQYQEYLNTLHSIHLVLLPKEILHLRNSNTIASTKERKKAAQLAKEQKDKDFKPIASFQELGFADQNAFNEFQNFFKSYLAYNSDIMELLLALASLGCFQLEPARKI